ncbi:hypothetical protein CIL02_05135 [Prevotella sp. P3-122]|nr:hypothetical protein CIL02_05135 [Prevotella sp. P3-122]
MQQFSYLVAIHLAFYHGIEIVALTNLAPVNAEGESFLQHKVKPDTRRTTIAFYEWMSHIHFYILVHNPIEHRLFSQITRSWNGAPLLNLQNAANRAAMATTKKGLKVHVHIKSKNYDIKRPIDESYQKRLARQVVFAPELGKWYYLVKPDN